MDDHPDEPTTPHRAARIENAFSSAMDRRLRARGYSPRVIPFTGYGSHGWARVLARVLLVPPGSGRASHDSRGWRRFATTSAAGVAVTVRLGSHEHLVVSDRDGYVDLQLESDLAAGWQQAILVVEGADPVPAPLRIVDPDTQFGMISDVDDTVIVTMLPKPLIAFRNAFLVRETNRDPVSGMAALYGDLVAAHPDLFVVYLSTGAWNTAGPMSRFLQRHGFPAGPLLMTDWGPTTEGWFRSGQRHKREQLRRLFGEFPKVQWLLVGDDGQHDPQLYAEAAQDYPDHVLEIAIRQVPLGERVAAHGTAAPHGTLSASERAVTAGQVKAHDGHGLREGLAARGILGE